MAKWSNGSPCDSMGNPKTGNPEQQVAMKAYVDEVRKNLEAERDYLIEYYRRVSGRDILDKEIASLTAEELDKVLSS
jgi:hypothetical protein